VHAAEKLLGNKEQKREKKNRSRVRRLRQNGNFKE
jgi:hypothetical protein